MCIEFVYEEEEEEEEEERTERSRLVRIVAYFVRADFLRKVIRAPPFYCSTAARAHRNVVDISRFLLRVVPGGMQEGRIEDNRLARFEGNHAAAAIDVEEGLHFRRADRDEHVHHIGVDVDMQLNPRSALFRLEADDFGNEDVVFARERCRRVDRSLESLASLFEFFIPRCVVA